MPRIGAAFGLVFYVYAEDHNPPHLHAIYGDEAAVLVIETGDVLAGEVSGAKLKQAQQWLEENRPLAVAAWQRLNP
jgi:hypothetical protein